MARAIGKETVARLRAVSAGGQFGVPGVDSELLIEGCARVPRTSSEGGGPQETTGQQDTVTIGETLFLPAGSDVLATDRFRCPADGGPDDVYEVEGEPGHYRTRRRNLEKVVIVALRRMTG